MKNTYFDLIEQSYYFPQVGSDLQKDNLTFHGISLKHLIEKHGTPFRFIYLPQIGSQIKKTRNLFNRAIKNSGYKGKYHFCYCTNYNHFYIVIQEALKHKVNLETSSAFVDLIQNLFKKKKIDKRRIIVHNGYKTENYLKKIIQLKESGFENALKLMTDDMYITIDLDVFDPAIMPATGTPEPGGMQGYETLGFLRRVFAEKNVLGFDIVEFAPIKELHAPGFLVA